jgi:GrpB-like predicted nucleotidyltransferase (UPF0157 family)/RimJ/RimL family protein N-acetyltransferase
MSPDQRHIEVTAHNPHWVAAFRQEAVLLKSLFGDQALAIHHIGSTSVPGLPAKPIIDVLLEVRDIEAIDAYNQRMRELGYEPRGEYGLPRRRYFPKIIDGKRYSQVHTWQTRDPEIERHLSFRDYLISHPQTSSEYGRIKEELALRFPHDIDGYMDGKNAFCQETEKLALDWSRKIRNQTLQTERLTLLPLNPAQLGHYLNRPSQLEAALHLQISRNILADPVPRAIRSKIRMTTAAELKQLLWQTYWLAIINDKAFGAGLIGFKGAPESDGTVEIGYGIDAHVRRQGLTTEAVQALLNWAFSKPECQAVTARTKMDNIPSIRVLEKLGFSLARETDEELCWIVAESSG